MIVGYNHNVTYRGVGFHVQTEDSGVKTAQLVTLLYHSGTIIASQKTTYADIIKVENLEKVVEELAKEQHKGMLRRLISGEFDERIGQFGISLEATGDAPQSPASAVPDAGIPVAPEDLPEIPAAPEEAVAEEETAATASIDIETPAEVTIVEEPIVDKFRKPKVSNEPSLDELIYAYLTAGRTD